MRLSWATWIFLAACQSASSGSSPSDARVDVAPYMPCSYVLPPPAGIPPCSQTCGNGVVETCYTTRLNGAGCAEPQVVTETCDGAAAGSGLDCTALGFYGGSDTCNTTCNGVDTTNCQACAPSDDACAQATTWIRTLSANGANIAALGNSDVEIYAGTTLSATVPIAVTSIVPASSGWLLSNLQTMQLATLSPAGVLGTAYSINAATAPTLTVGPGGLVAAVWGANGQDNNWVVALIDSSTGATTLAATPLLTNVFPSTISDGTANFFFATSGSITRIATNGTRAILAGFQAAQPPQLFWTGATGWYVDETSMTIQLFDANGPTGSPFVATLPGTLEGLASSQTQLVALVLSGTHLELVTIDPDGTVSAPVVVGGGALTSAAITAYGSGVAVGWDQANAFVLALQHL